jgi:hypothetical protein
MAFVLGLNAKTYINTANTMANPTWLYVPTIKDETLNMTSALADVTTRQANGWRLQTGTLSEGTVDATIIYDTADVVGFLAFRTSYFNKARILMGFFDGLITVAGTQGLKGGFMVTSFTIGRQLEEAMTVDLTFTVVPDNVGSGPTWHTQS